MIHPHTELRYINDIIGYGVVATKFIPKGTITWVKDKLDREFTKRKIKRFDPLYRDILEKYCYIDNRGRYVLCWDIARFVNHSFNSNCISTAYEFEIAVRDIHPGEELTDDYGYLNVTEPFECAPEPGTERTHVMPDDLLQYHPLWDKKLKNAFSSFVQVEQSLSVLLPKDILEKSKRISKGEEEMDSILNCYFDKKKKVISKPFSLNTH
jgi:uncharacterized protein